MRGNEGHSLGSSRLRRGVCFVQRVRGVRLADKLATGPHICVTSFCCGGRAGKNGPLFVSADLLLVPPRSDCPLSFPSLYVNLSLRVCVRIDSTRFFLCPSVPLSFCLRVRCGLVFLRRLFKCSCSFGGLGNDWGGRVRCCFHYRRIGCEQSTYLL